MIFMSFENQYVTYY